MDDCNSPMNGLEFRPRANGKFDEIVAHFADGMVHVETMSATGCYVGFYWNDGRYCQWWINSKKTLEYHHEHGRNTQPTAPDLIAGDADLIVPPYATKADSDGDDGA